MKKFTLSLVIVCLMASVSFGAYDQAAWQNISSYTSQSWDFDALNTANLVVTTGGYSYVEVADTYVNPFTAALGFEPTVTITNIDSYSWVSSYYGQNGVWNIARNEFRDFYLDIPNDDTNTGEDSWKEMRISFVYYYDATPNVYPDGDAMFAFTGSFAVNQNLVSNVDLGSGWHEATYDVVIAPNPAWERIYIKPDACTSYLDSIVVETICIPEPATLALLAIGMLAWIKRRK